MEALCNCKYCNCWSNLKHEFLRIEIERPRH